VHKQACISRCHTKPRSSISIESLLFVTKQKGKEMVAIEFQAQIKNGVIEIPEAYRDQLAESVRVIILPPDKALRVSSHNY
jgi:hypothetical protein